MKRIFISYKRLDKDKVFKIKDQIEAAIGPECWIDLRGIKSDAQFVSVIMEAIDNAEIVLFMYSCRHGQITNYDNDWTIREINYANEQRKRIVFINIDGSPLTKWFLFMYAQKQQVDGSSEVAIDSLISDLAEWLGIERQDVRKAQEEAERKAKEEAERKAKEEAERKAQEEAERKAQEETERKAKEEAERRRKETAELVAKAEAAKKERDAREAAERKVAEAAKSFDQKGEEERTRRAYLRIAESEEQKKLLKKSLAIALGAIALIGIIIGVSSKGGSSSESSIDSLSNSSSNSLPVNTSNVKAATYSNGHEYVDLGLSVKWATCNVGANKSEDYGDYYAWGETETKSNYDWSTYKWMKSGYSDWKHINKYTLPDRETSGIWYNNGTFVGDNKIVLDPEDDVARVMWGGDWRIPTDAEREELLDINNCTWTWTTQGGKNGFLVTSKKNGNSIFLPAAGCRNGSSLYDADSCGYYWSSCQGTNGSYGSQNAYGVYFNSDIVSPDYGSRTYGLSVRPVCP